MLRVFIELSLDHFIEYTLHWPEQQIANTSLQKKMQAAHTHIKKTGQLSENKLAGFDQASKTNSILAPTYKTLHGYVHNYNLVD